MLLNYCNKSSANKLQLWSLKRGLYSNRTLHCWRVGLDGRNGDIAASENRFYCIRLTVPGCVRSTESWLCNSALLCVQLREWTWCIHVLRVLQQTSERVSCLSVEILHLSVAWIPPGNHCSSITVQLSLVLSPTKECRVDRECFWISLAILHQVVCCQRTLYS